MFVQEGDGVVRGLASNQLQMRHTSPDGRGFNQVPDVVAPAALVGRGAGKGLPSSQLSGGGTGFEGAMSAPINGIGAGDDYGMMSRSHDEFSKGALSSSVLLVLFIFV